MKNIKKILIAAFLMVVCAISLTVITSFKPNESKDIKKDYTVGDFTRNGITYYVFTTPDGGIDVVCHTANMNLIRKQNK